MVLPTNRNLILFCNLKQTSTVLSMKIKLDTYIDIKCCECECVILFLNSADSEMPNFMKWCDDLVILVCFRAQFRTDKETIKTLVKL